MNYLLDRMDNTFLAHMGKTNVLLNLVKDVLFLMLIETFNFRRVGAGIEQCSVDACNQTCVQAFIGCDEIMFRLGLKFGREGTERRG